MEGLSIKKIKPLNPYHRKETGTWVEELKLLLLKYPGYRGRIRPRGTMYPVNDNSRIKTLRVLKVKTYFRLTHLRQ